MIQEKVRGRIIKTMGRGEKRGWDLVLNKGLAFSKEHRQTGIIIGTKAGRMSRDAGKHVYASVGACGSSLPMKSPARSEHKDGRSVVSQKRKEKGVK